MSEMSGNEKENEAKPDTNSEEPKKKRRGWWSLGG